jgi:hypothetical protein
MGTDGRGEEESRLAFNGAEPQRSAQVVTGRTLSGKVCYGEFRILGKRRGGDGSDSRAPRASGTISPVRAGRVPDG